MHPSGLVKREEWGTWRTVGLSDGEGERERFEVDRTMRNEADFMSTSISGSKTRDQLDSCTS
jgi:hypothetical protein